ncbi:hypothetical protein AURDEDRAFT_165536 [Auricularia subglabra TFB-10046 SS5]|nr:hypothetical protein AURDEDRAFT_165536 [Auricularia subglabra TFB-10046 SS5]
MRFSLSTISLSAVLLSSGASAVLTCTTVARGALTVVKSTNSTACTTKLGLSPVTDGDGDGFVQENATPVVYTLQKCSSSYMGFAASQVVDGKYRANGRYVLNGRCLIRESDGALALKKCATKDDSSLVNQFFTVFWQGSTPSGVAQTRLLFGPSNNYPSVVYTNVFNRRGNNVVSQLRNAPSAGNAYNLRFTTV